LAPANERGALKPACAQNWRMAARAHVGLGDHNQKSKCDTRAEALLAA